MPLGFSQDTDRDLSYRGIAASVNEPGEDDDWLPAEENFFLIISSLTTRLRMKLPGRVPTGSVQISQASSLITACRTCSMLPRLNETAAETGVNFHVVKLHAGETGPGPRLR